MSLDRKKWLETRCTPRNIAKHRARLIWISVTLVFQKDGPTLTKKSQGTRSVGTNAAKRMLGKGKKRVKTRKAMQRGPASADATAAEGSGMTTGNVIVTSGLRRRLTAVLTPHGVKVVANWNDAVRRLASDPAALDAWADERGCLEDLQRFRRILARRSRGFKSCARMMRRRDPKWRTAYHEKPYVPRWRKSADHGVAIP